MAAVLFQRFARALERFEAALGNLFPPNYPPAALCALELPQQAPQASESQPKWSLKEIWGEGFLWAVPKHRRTIEKRLKRKFGNPEYNLKTLKPKTNIRTCNVCGDDHLTGVLCPTCYKKVIDETREMQDAIQNELKLEPVEKEVVVLYEGEKQEKSDEFFEGKRVVEMKKPRPSWFSKNLMQQTTQQPATTTDVKPSDLG